MQLVFEHKTNKSIYKQVNLQSFPRLVSLEELYLEGNKLQDITMLSAHAQRVQILDLRNNDITRCVFIFYDPIYLHLMQHISFSQSESVRTTS